MDELYAPPNSTMSNSLKKVDILELMDQFRNALDAIQELPGQLPDGAFKEMVPDDLMSKLDQAEKPVKDLMNVIKELESVNAEVDNEESKQVKNMLQTMKTLIQQRVEFFDSYRKKLMDLEKEGVRRTTLLTATLEAKVKLIDNLRKDRVSSLKGKSKIDLYFTKNPECLTVFVKCIADVCGNDSEQMKDFLATAVKETFKRQDPFVKVTSENLDLVKQLRMANLVEDHPHDAKKIRFFSHDLL